MGEIHRCVETLPVWWDRFQTNIHAYLIKGKKNAVVDTGAPGTSIGTVLESFGLSLPDIDFALNTHGHSDHIGGNAALKSAGAKLMIHRMEVDFIEDQSKAFDRFVYPLAKALGGESGAAEEKKAFLKDMAPELKVDRKLEDNDLIDLGGDIELRVVHLPGHSAGSAGFYFEREGILFAGDSAPGLGTPGGSLPILYDLEAYEASLGRLTEMEPQCILSAHPYRGVNLAPSIVKKKGEVKQFLSDSLDAARRIREAIDHQAAKGSDRPLDEITDAVIAELPVKMGFNPLTEVPVPRFPIGTVFWGLQEKRGK